MDKYNQRGVSASKEEIHRAIENLDKGIFPNAFCKILPDIVGNDTNYCNIMHSDGAGTKSSLAYAYWRATGDLDVWKGIAQDALVMNLDDLICVGVTDNILISSTIGRNKNLVSGEVIAKIIEGTVEFIEKMRSYGVNMYLTGGETADVGDLVRTIIVDATAMARIHRNKIIETKIKEDNVIVGLASFGQATYENNYNSGIGSNGLTSARHDLLNKSIGQLYPETYDNSLDDNVVYTGTFSLLDNIEPLNIPAGKFLLSPTRTYAPIVKEVLESFFDKINGIIHCTGGGQTKVLNFADKIHIVKDNLFATPPLFRLLSQAYSDNYAEMYRVFNMGHRMEIYTDQLTANEIIKISEKYNVEAQIVGKCYKCDEKKLTIKTEFGEFIY